MKSQTFKNFDASRVPSPCFVVDSVALTRNLEMLADVQTRSGAKILLALKAFSMFHFAPLISKYLAGTCASGFNEAQLGKYEFGGEVHTFSTGFTANSLKEIASLSNHLIFNSLSQWQRFQNQFASLESTNPSLKFGLRINPLHSEGTVAIYDPCAPCSRLGEPLGETLIQSSDKLISEGLTGIHFHTLCEQGYDALDRTLKVIEKKLPDLLKALEWVNFGGGHHITAPEYEIEKLIEHIIDFRQAYNVNVYLEPGEAIAINTGVLVTEVLDITQNSMPLAILDTSATCHMPDTIEMPYRAEILHAGTPNQYAYTYRLGGQTCLAGDVMGDYSFHQPLAVGQRLIFDDMAHYTMVKTTTFNGINLPAIAAWNSETDELTLVREFGYEDFKSRLS